MKYIDTTLLPNTEGNGGTAKFTKPSHLIEQGYKILHIHEINYMYKSDTYETNYISQIYDMAHTNITPDRLTYYNPDNMYDEGKYNQVVRAHTIMINGLLPGFSMKEYGLFIDLEKSKRVEDNIIFRGAKQPAPYNIDFRVKLKCTAITGADIEQNHLNIARILNAYKNRYTTCGLLIAV